METLTSKRGTTMLGQHEKGTPLRFPIGTRVSVRLSPTSVPGTGTSDLISIHHCAGGPSVSATVVEHECHQPGWCPTYVVAYVVSVDGDTDADGRMVVTATNTMSVGR